MNELYHSFVSLSTLEIVVKGFIIGLAAAAPTGPSGIFSIQRTLNKGRKYGFVTGLGVAVSDFFYVICTSFGLSLIIGFIQDKQTFFIIRVVGCCLLLFFGIHTLRNNPLGNLKSTQNKKGSLWYNFASGFLVAFSNPLVILIYLALFAYFSFAPNEFHNATRFLGYLSVLLGDLFWWFILTFLVDKLRNRFDLKGIWMINRIFGVVLILVSLIWLIFTLFAAE